MGVLEDGLNAVVAGRYGVSEGNSSWVISSRLPSTTINTAWGNRRSPDRKCRYLRLSASSTSILSAGVICTVASLIEKLHKVVDASTETRCGSYWLSLASDVSFSPARMAHLRRLWLWGARHQTTGSARSGATVGHSGSRPQGLFRRQAGTVQEPVESLHLPDQIPAQLGNALGEADHSALFEGSPPDSGRIKDSLAVRTKLPVASLKNCSSIFASGRRGPAPERLRSGGAGLDMRPG